MPMTVPSLGASSEPNAIQRAERSKVAMRRDLAMAVSLADSQVPNSPTRRIWKTRILCISSASCQPPVRQWEDPDSRSELRGRKLRDSQSRCNRRFDFHVSANGSICRLPAECDRRTACCERNTSNSVAQPIRRWEKAATVCPPMTKTVRSAFLEVYNYVTVFYK